MDKNGENKEKNLQGGTGNNPDRNSTGGKGIIKWFKNVFIYHYLKPTITVIIVLAVVIYLLYDFSSVKKPDITIVFGGVNILREEDMTEIKAIIEDEVGDANGDGEVFVNFELYSATLTPTDDYGKQNLQALDLAFLADTDKVLFILDDELYQRYEPDFFEKLSDYGIESEDDIFYSVNHLPVFERLFVVDNEHFMALKGWMVDERDNPEYIHNYDLAVRVMKRLINEK